MGFYRYAPRAASVVAESGLSCTGCQSSPLIGWRRNILRMRLLSMNSLYDCSPTASNSLTAKLVLYCRRVVNALAVEIEPPFGFL